MPNPNPTPFNQRRRSDQYTKEPVSIAWCSVTAEAWEGLQYIAEGFREDKHKLPVTRFLNRYAYMFRILNLPPFMIEAKKQQGGVWKRSDFDSGEPRIPRRLMLTDATRLHLETLPHAFDLPLIFGPSGGSEIGMSLELIGRGWITR